MAIDTNPIVLSLQCSFVSALINLPWGIFWGWILARKDFPGKNLLQTLLYFPLVLPPVLTGYFLLIILSPNALLGHFFSNMLGWQFVFDWKGVVLAASVVSGPFMIQMMKEAVQGVDARMELAARSLGASPWRVFWSVTFPLCRHGVIAGFFLVFARSLGEFGATIIFAGNIAGKTQTIPVAIYSKVYLGQEAEMFPFVLAALILAYGGLSLSQYFSQKAR